MQQVLRVTLVSAMLCAPIMPLTACDSSANDKACDIPVSLSSSTVRAGESLRATLTEPSCFDEMSADKQSRERISISVPGAKNAPQVPITFAQEKFTHDFVIPKSAEAGKATLEIPYQCSDGASCAAQSVTFTIVK